MRCVSPIDASFDNSRKIVFTQTAERQKKKKEEKEEEEEEDNKSQQKKKKKKEDEEDNKSQRDGNLALSVCLF